MPAHLPVRVMEVRESIKSNFLFRSCLLMTYSTLSLLQTLAPLWTVIKAMSGQADPAIYASSQSSLRDALILTLVMCVRLVVCGIGVRYADTRSRVNKSWLFISELTQAANHSAVPTAYTQHQATIRWKIMSGLHTKVIIILAPTLSSISQLWYALPVSSALIILLLTHSLLVVFDQNFLILDSPMTLWPI